MKYRVSPVSPFGVMIMPTVDGQRLGDVGGATIRDYFRKNQLVILRGFESPQDEIEFVSYCETWGEVSLWPFGKVLNLQEQESPQDHIFDHQYVPLHWDGMYRPQIPEVQIFHCVKASPKGMGGETTFSNTALALKNISSEVRHLWSQVTGRYQRKMAFYSSTTMSAVVVKHPYRDFEVIRYNEPPSQGRGHFINPPTLEFWGLDEVLMSEFHHSLQSALTAKQNYYQHSWQDGDIVVADNFTLLHGRNAFISRTPRHLRRVHVLSDPPFDNPGLESYA